MYEIDRDVPAPKDNARQRFPWRDMQIGDSFVVPAPEGFQTLKVRSARTAMVKAQKVTGFVFISRKDGDFVRFWRVH